MKKVINQEGLLALYTYNAYANKLLLDTVEQLTSEEMVRECSPSHGSVHGLLTHMLACEAFFLAQCQGRSLDLERVDLSTLANIRRYWGELKGTQRDFISSLDQTTLAREVQVQIRAQQLVFPVGELLLQALVHSIHHRGELSIVLTGLGYPLPTLDILLHFIQHSGQRWPYISAHRALKTERLLLRASQLDDAAEIFSAVQSPQFPDPVPLKEMQAVDDVRAWLQRLQAGWEDGRVFSWILQAHGAEKIIGQVTLSKTEGEHVWAMAFWTHPEQWGKGYATEGAARVLAFGFEELGAQKIWAGAGQWNTGSMRVLEKIGLRYRGDNPEGYVSRGEPVPTIEYEISRQEWQARAGA